MRKLKIRHERLPRIGELFELVSSSGGVVTVVSQRSGRRDLSIGAHVAARTDRHRFTDEGGGHRAGGAAGRRAHRADHRSERLSSRRGLSPRMIVILAVFGVIGLALVAFGSSLGRRAFLVGAVPMVAAASWVGSKLGDVTSGGVITEQAAWVSGLGLTIDLRLDGLAATMSLIVAVVGVAVLVYAARYFAADARGPRPPRRAAGAVRRLDARPRPSRPRHRAVHVLGADVDHVVPAHRQPAHRVAGPRRGAARAARHRRRRPRPARRARAPRPRGRHATGSARSWPTRPPASAAVTAAMVLVLVGAFTKSAQYPFHAWLPGRDGRADTGQRVPALGDDGDGRRVPRRPARADVRRRRTSWRPLVLTVGLLHARRSAACGRCASTT